MPYKERKRLTSKSTWLFAVLLLAMEKESVGAEKAGPGHKRVLCRESQVLVFLWEAGRSWMLGRSVRLYFIYRFNINIVIGMDGAFRGTVLVSYWGRVREGIIQQWWKCR